MPISESLLERLRCPESRQPLKLATPAQLGAINGRLENPVEAALIREDRKRAYPIRDGFPILLLGEAIDL